MNILIGALVVSLFQPMKIVNKPFKHGGLRDTSVNYLVIHNDSSMNSKTTFSFLKKKRNAYHYYIDESGVLYKLIDPKYQANHAGLSFYEGHIRMNRYSIGICLGNMPPRRYKETQYNSLAWLIVELQHRFPDSQYRPVIGHKDIAFPRGRKSDPGPQFDWQLLNYYIQIYQSLYDRKHFADRPRKKSEIGFLFPISKMGQLPMAVETPIY